MMRQAAALHLRSVVQSGLSAWKIEVIPDMLQVVLCSVLLGNKNSRWGRVEKFRDGSLFDAQIATEFGLGLVDRVVVHSRTRGLAIDSVVKTGAGVGRTGQISRHVGRGT